MNHQERAASAKSAERGHQGPGPRLMGAGTLIGDHVHNLKNEHLGEVREIMLDMHTGNIAYAVMSSGSVFTIGEMLFAVPWQALTLDTAHKRFTLNIDKERLDQAPSFDIDRWPDMASPAWASEVQRYYGSGAR